MANSDSVPNTDSSHWLTSVKSDEDSTAEETINDLIGTRKVFFFGDRTPGRSQMKTGDWICFYATKQGIVAHAEILSPPERTAEIKVRQTAQYAWIVRLGSIRVYTKNPTAFSNEVIGKLDAFKSRDHFSNWNWFVQATHRVTHHDFAILTGGR